LPQRRRGDAGSVGKVNGNVGRGEDDLEDVQRVRVKVGCRRTEEINTRLEKPFRPAEFDQFKLSIQFPLLLGQEGLEQWVLDFANRQRKKPFTCGGDIDTGIAILKPWRDFETAGSKLFPQILGAIRCHRTEPVEVSGDAYHLGIYESGHHGQSRRHAIA
jgi:hypothetical protein